jgi:hypothetical protein
METLSKHLKPGTDDGFLSGEIENIVFTPTKICGFLSASSADCGQSSAQSFAHMTLEQAVIGYTRKMFRGFVGITRRRQTNVFGRAVLLFMSHWHKR